MCIGDPPAFAPDPLRGAWGLVENRSGRTNPPRAYLRVCQPSEPRDRITCECAARLDRRLRPM